MTDDDQIALQLMRLYKQLRQTHDSEARAQVCATIDALIQQLKHPVTPPRASHATAARPFAKSDD